MTDALATAKNSQEGRARTLNFLVSESEVCEQVHCLLKAVFDYQTCVKFGIEISAISPRSFDTCLQECQVCCLILEKTVWMKLSMLGRVCTHKAGKNDGIDTQLNMVIDTYASGIELLSGTYLRFERL